MSDQQITDGKFCSACGTNIRKEAWLCPKCGVRQMGVEKQSSEEDSADAIAKVGSLCVPFPVGLILYFVYKDSKPKAAKDVCTFALIGAGIIIGLNIVSTVLFGGFMALLGL